MTRARAMASRRCWPPDRSPPRRRSISPSAGNRPNASWGVERSGRGRGRNPSRGSPVIDRRDRLLVRRGPGIEDVALTLLALVLDRIEQDRVQLLEDRQHRLAAHAGPSAEDRRHTIDLDQLARLLREERPIGGGSTTAAASGPLSAFCSSISISITSFGVVSARLREAPSRLRPAPSSSDPHVVVSPPKAVPAPRRLAASAACGGGGTLVQGRAGARRGRR